LSGTREIRKTSARGQENSKKSAIFWADAPIVLTAEKLSSKSA